MVISYTMSIDLTFFKEKITNFIESQHTKEEIDETSRLEWEGK